MADYLRELDAREQHEQIRDWAVLGTLTRTGASVAQLAAASYQVPPARLPYLDELYAFEYGRGRRAYLANRVLLFRDRDDPDPQATIGRLADRVRMESGEVPRVVELYLVDDQRDQGTIRVERAADLTRDQVFSDAYGYVEGDAHTLAELSAWLNRIDDLTYARLTWDGHLHLGGRRFAATRTDNLDIGDIAAIYQSQKNLDQRRLDALEELGQLPPILTGELGRYFGLAHQGAPDDRQRAALDAFEAKLTFLPGSQRTRVQRALYTWFNGDAAPGFSLDPEWLPDPEHADHPLMLARIRAFAADPCADLQRIARRAAELVREQPDESRRTSRAAMAAWIRDELPPPGTAIPPAACARLRAQVSIALEDLALQLDSLAPDAWDIGFAAYYRLKSGWKHQVATRHDDLLGAAGLALEFHEQDTRIQCARYDGLTGTSAGMTLFYTDLLAKLWSSTDFAHSAPAADVPGFVSEPREELATAFQHDPGELHGTRVWFGARGSGVSRAGDPREPAFAFDHRFTRLYAAGRDPAHPGAETQPDERSRRSLGWWDRHFDDVADYEQQYHRQNQIMKWSLVAAVLPGTPLGMALRTADVFRNYKFADWQQSHRRVLRFGEKLPQVTQGIPGRECIPLLSSYDFTPFGNGRAVIRGGVSMAGRAAPRAVSVIEAEAPLGARLSTEAVDLGAGTSGTATRAAAQLEGEVVTFRNAALAPTRTAAGEVSIGTPRVSYAQGASRGSVVIRAGEGPTEIGELEARAGTSRVAMQWEEGAVERARLGKPELPARTLDAADRAAQGGRAVDAARVYERGLPRDLPPADRLARQAIVDIARRRPAALEAKLEQLAAGGKQLSPGARDALVGALRRDSAAVAQRVEASLETGAPLRTADTSLTVARGRLIVTRDVTLPPRTSVPTPATDLSKNIVYIDSQLRIGQDGLLPDPGGSVARWAQVRNVRVIELKASEIGALPERLVEKSTGLTLDRAPIWPLPASPRVFVIQKCDAEHRTATTQDDCDRR